MMMVRWGIFIDAGDPITAADDAAAALISGAAHHWTVTDLDSNETFVVDLANRKVIPPG
jgi:uncharacterized Rossmann fold enzyme